MVGAGSQRRAKPERGRNVGFEVPQLLLAAVRIRGFAAVFRSGCAREGADGVQTEQWRPLRSAAPLAQGPTVIKNERFTDLLPKPTTSKKVSPLHGIYAEQYHPCTPITRRKGRKSWGLGGRETLAALRSRRFGRARAAPFAGSRLRPRFAVVSAGEIFHLRSIHVGCVSQRQRLQTANRPEGNSMPLWRLQWVIGSFSLCH